MKISHTKHSLHQEMNNLEFDVLSHDHCLFQNVYTFLQIDICKLSKNK